MSNRWTNNLLQNCIQFESMAALTADTDQTLYTFHPDLFNIGPIPKWLHGRMPGYCMDCDYRADACYCDWPAPICVTDPKCRVRCDPQHAVGERPLPFKEPWWGGKMRALRAETHQFRFTVVHRGTSCVRIPFLAWTMYDLDVMVRVLRLWGVPHKCKQLNKNKPKKCLEIVLLRSLRRKMIPKSLRVEKC
jgi:hypothetical protein